MEGLGIKASWTGTREPKVWKPLQDHQPSVVGEGGEARHPRGCHEGVFQHPSVLGGRQRDVQKALDRRCRLDQGDWAQVPFDLRMPSLWSLPVPGKWLVLHRDPGAHDGGARVDGGYQ